MKDIFAGFLSVSISGIILICIILLLRLIFKKAPKAIICALWLVAVVRLLLPFQLETTWSLRPELPLVTGENTQLFIDAEPVIQGDIPAVVPQQTMEGTYLVVVDYLKIATVLWLVGICVIGIYTLISYLRLKFWVREAILKEKGLYVSANVETAFLLGYIRPKIYLPTDITAEEAQLVIAHERAHIRRGDNWLKLLGFICLTVHWFNPLVWLAYAMLCRDIEDACDEHVIRKLDAEERKVYSSALLACGKKSRKIFGCPVAFGEISIRQRIVHILSYRKPAAWISVILVVAMVAVSVFFVTDPIAQQTPPYYETLMDLLGEPMDTVCSELGISEADLGGNEIVRGVYDTPIQVEYQGVKLTVRLGFSFYNDLLSSFTYYATYEGNHEQAAVDIVKISKRLWKNFGKGYQWYEQDEPKRLKESSVEDVLARYEERNVNNLAWDQWDLTHDASKSAKTWLDQIQVSADWQKAYAEKARLYGVDPHFYLEFRAAYDKERDITVIDLSHQTGWQPGHYGSMVSGDYN